MPIEGADNSIASDFLADMFGASTAAPVFICSMPNADAPAGEPRERHVATRELDHVERFLKKWDRKDRALYFAVATLQPGSTTRSKATLAELNCLHVDIDAKSITIDLTEAERRLQQVLHLPSKVVHSGGGLHAYWLFKEALPATPENIERVEALLRLLADHVGGDLACAEASRLMRLPGSHNSKAGAWTEVRLIADRPLRYELGDLTEWLETASPVIQRKPADSGNGHDAGNPWLAVAERFAVKPPVDVEQRLSSMTFRGAGDAGIHATQVSVSAALLNRGEAIDDVISIVLDATRAAAGEFGSRWNWRREERAIRQMCESWLAKHPEVKAQADDKIKPPKSSLHWHGDSDPAEARAWLVQDLLPEIGKGLMSGQWGLFKSFIALDLAAAVMAGGDFINFPVLRRGGVLYIAAEGAGEITIRLQAVLETKYPQIKRAAFAWIGSCTPLLERGAAKSLIALADEAAARMQAEFKLPLALIVIDTLTAAAGYAKAGDENDAAIGQIIMNVLERLAQHSGAMVLVLDHFGKVAETGTRGTSAKESAADVVLALLGAKSISGEITAPKLAIRKRRSGPAGEEFSFSVQSVDMGLNQHGGQITTLIVK
jgi:AAA domain/RepB DNA-primase N-terminal domain